MDYSDWTTYPEDILPDGKYLVALHHRGTMEEEQVTLTIRTGIVIIQEGNTENMPNFVGEDEVELRLFINNNEDGVEEYAIKEAA